MPRRTNWYEMTRTPDYPGDYEVQASEAVVMATFTNGQWSGQAETYAAWRGVETRLLTREGDALREALSKAHNSPAYRADAAAAAVTLARSARERSARAGDYKIGARKALEYFHAAIGLDAKLDAFDVDFVTTWWKHLSPAGRKRIEVRVAKLVSPVPTKILPRKIV